MLDAKQTTTINNIAVDIAMKYRSKLLEKEMVALAKDIKAAFHTVLRAENDALTAQMQSLLAGANRIEDLLRGGGEEGAPTHITTIEQWEAWQESVEYLVWRREMVASLNLKRLEYRKLKAQRTTLNIKQKQI